MIKVFGIGNILLCDDGIGVRVAENLKEDIEALSDDIEVIIGETNAIYCINNIEYDDKIIVIDSTYFMTRPGMMVVKSLDECDEFTNYDYSLHEESLLTLLRKEKRDVKGYLIGIEISHIDYSEKLSKILNRKFKDICNRVYSEIVEIVS